MLVDTCMMAFIVAAAQYPIERLDDWGAYERKITIWIEKAVAGGASIAVFPEYAAMELASLDPTTMSDLRLSMAFVANLLVRVDALHLELAKKHKLHILAASTLARLEDGSFVNRARLFTPGGRVGVQDKMIMTRFEREQWGVSGGQALRLFDTSLGRIGITICYDSEFPLLARALVEAGMDLLLVPSCTEKEHGYWRVRIGAQARALEGQCYAVQSPTVGSASWSPSVDTNCGAAAIYAPPDRDFPPNGVVAIGNLNEAQWVFGKVDLSLVATLRSAGDVLNMQHWSEQPGAFGLPLVEVIDLRQPSS